MGFLSRVFGGRGDDEAAPSSPPPSTSVLTSEHAPSPVPQSPLNLPKSLQMPDAVPEGVEGLFKPQETTRLYNPYAGLHSIDPRQQQQRQFRISTQPEFVFQEEASHKRRSASENLGYYTGAGYLGGAVLGGSVGLAQGVMYRPEITTSSRRLLINRLLNTSGQTGRLAAAVNMLPCKDIVTLQGVHLTSEAGGGGTTKLLDSSCACKVLAWISDDLSFAGNTLGALGLMFALSESMSWYLLDTYSPYSPSWYGTIAAGALAGGIYRTPRGVKAAAITAGVGAMAGAALLALRQVFPGL